MGVSDKWQNFNFGVEYPFKILSISDVVLLLLTKNIKKNIFINWNKAEKNWHLLVAKATLPILI